MGRVNSSISGLFLAATIELTADERKKLEALHREMVESEQSQTRAEHDWRDCKYQLVVDHLGNSATGGYSDVTLSTGKVVRIPAPWNEIGRASCRERVWSAEDGEGVKNKRRTRK